MYPPIRNAADSRRLGDRPLEEVVPAPNAFEAICRSAAAYPDNIALKLLTPGDVEAPAREVSYRAFLARSYQTANMLHDLGLRPGEVVSFLLPICPQAYYTIVGGEAAGIVNAVNPLLEEWQIVRILRAADTKILVALGPEPDAEIWQKVQAIKAELPKLATVLQVGGAPVEDDGVKSFDALVEQYPDDRLISRRAIRPDDVATYFHTGGTTGTPKLARHTHWMQVSQLWSTGAAMGLGPTDVITAGLPLFHIGGSIVCGLVPLAHGATLLVPSPAGFRDPTAVRDCWLMVHNHKVTIFLGVPTVLGASLNVPVGNADISSIRYVFTGGAPLPVEVGKALAKHIGREVIEGYGMTESTSFVTMGPRDGPARTGSAGVPMAHVEIKSVELDGNGGIARECDVEEIGHIVMRGAAIMSSYVQESYNVGTILADGWLDSGDLGRFDKDGYLWITGRAKDLIIRGGHNIDPAVIEETLHQHPAVGLAAAIGQPDAYAGELPIAYVQLQPDASATADELKAFVRERIPERAANPVNIFLVDPMPQTAVGKIFKPELRWDAIRRVFDGLIRPLAEAAGAAATVGVGADDQHGTAATIIVTGTGTVPGAELEQRIREALAPFAVHYRIDLR